MSPLTFSGTCPICGKGPLRQLPVGYRMFIENGTQKQQIGGLIAVQCVVEGHVFFVRAADLEENIAGVKNFS